MRLKDDLSGDEWQRVRNGQVLGAADAPPVLEPLSDDMPMEAWQQARNRQVGQVLLVEAGRVGAAPEAPKPDVDWEFIRKREGSRSDMYLPEKGGVVIGKSGPTIGKGVDLGQRNLAGLKSLRLSPATEAKLTPYLGRKGEPAAAFVKANPLVLADDELEELNGAVRKQELDQLERNYDAASQVGPFHKLPRNTQTAIASVYFQYGTADPAKGAPNYWRQVTTGDWDGAYRNLRAFGDDHQKRRDFEADILLGDMKAGSLPPKAR